MCSFLYWNMLDITVAAALACLPLSALKWKRHIISKKVMWIEWFKNVSNMDDFQTCCSRYTVADTLRYMSLRASYLLSWELLMPESLASPSKKAMSRAATSLQLTRLLSAPQMFITTSGEGSLGLPSAGSSDTKFGTTLGAKIGQILKRALLWMKNTKLHQFNNRLFLFLMRLLKKKKETCTYPDCFCPWHDGTGSWASQWEYAVLDHWVSWGDPEP